MLELSKVDNSFAAAVHGSSPIFLYATLAGPSTSQQHGGIPTARQMLRQEEATERWQKNPFSKLPSFQVLRSTLSPKTACPCAMACLLQRNFCSLCPCDVPSAASGGCAALQQAGAHVCPSMSSTSLVWRVCRFIQPKDILHGTQMRVGEPISLALSVLYSNAPWAS